MSGLRAVTIITGADAVGNPVEVTGLETMTLHFHPDDFTVEKDTTVTPGRVLVRSRSFIPNSVPVEPLVAGARRR
jgi:hypothetical protein